MTARRAVVRGRVQGVGFRFFAERAARDLGILGWVRNLPDGTVETLAVAEEEDDLRRYFDRLRKGPLGARVDAVDVSDVAQPPTFSSFEITR